MTTENELTTVFDCLMATGEWTDVSRYFDGSLAVTQHAYHNDDGEVYVQLVEEDSAYLISTTVLINDFSRADEKKQVDVVSVAAGIFYPLGVLVSARMEERVSKGIECTYTWYTPGEMREFIPLDRLADHCNELMDMTSNLGAHFIVPAKDFLQGKSTYAEFSKLMDDLINALDQGSEVMQ